MASQRTHLLQGRDWFTYRWTIAEAFDALERLQDLCIFPDFAQENLPEEHQSALFPLLNNFVNDFTSMLSIACADTIPSRSVFGDTAMRWKYVELQLWMGVLIAQTSTLSENNLSHFEETALILAEVKQLIRAIDT